VALVLSLVAAACLSAPPGSDDGARKADARKGDLEDGGGASDGTRASDALPGPTDGPTATDCTSRFASVPGFTDLCGESNGECDVAFADSGVSCNESCTAGGLTCMVAIANDTAGCLVGFDPRSCAEALPFRLCACLP
jgi:hypothetical protein